jgi:hypothetical protein
MRRNIALVTLAIGILAGSLESRSFAQGVQTGTIRGVVVDAQELPVPNVTITISSPSLQGVRTTSSAADGSYLFAALPPGRYEMAFELSSFAPVKQTTEVALGLTVEHNVMMNPAGVQEELQIVGELPAAIATPVVGANYTHAEINALATPRTLYGIAQLAPGLTDNTPNNTQVTINGSLAFDSIFMINGVDVNDNLLAQPQNLFIEDAIEETQVLTSGITAEYGRFTGGVVNAITRSGGNAVSGSFRTNLENPAWTVETPFERCDSEVTVASCRRAPERTNDLQASFEATLGGPIIRDRLWFFGAARRSNVETAGTLPFTNLPNTLVDENNRAEIKLTASPRRAQTIQGGYLANYREQSSRPNFSFSIDKAAVGTLNQPNWYTFFTYRGVSRGDVLTEARFSERRMKFKGGGSLTGIVDSPMITSTQANAHFNGQYFDASDPESRNNRQFTASVMKLLDRGDSGRHEIKLGYDYFRSQLITGNSQSATGFVFYTDYAVDAAGSPLIDAQGRLIPVFDSAFTELEEWRPDRGAVLNADTQSLYAQDHWVVAPRLTADLGVRFEHILSKASSGTVGIDTSSIVPRLALGYDVQGDGKRIARVTYGWYSGRANEAQVGENSNVGNPDFLLYGYVGPNGEGRSFTPGFDLSNYEIITGDFPTRSSSIAPDMRTPIAKELTVSFGEELMNGKGYAEVAYVHRNYDKLIDDVIDTTTGTTRIEADGLDFDVTNILYANVDQAFREYRGLLLQARYNLSNRWMVNGHYTLQLRNNGNYEGEAANQPGLPSLIADYPEVLSAERYWPSGRLDDFQRHKLRVWSIYTLSLNRYGALALSGLWRVDSGLSYSLRANGVRLTQLQNALLAAAGYVDSPGSQSVYFGERGSQSFKGYGLLDLSVNYDVPVFRALRPWVKVDVYNALNNQKLIRWNTTVAADATSQRDELGLPTGYVKGPSFGKATSTTNFPIPFQGNNGGGRTLRMSFGFRFGR